MQTSMGFMAGVLVLREERANETEKVKAHFTPAAIDTKAGEVKVELLSVRHGTSEKVKPRSGEHPEQTACCLPERESENR